MLKIGKREVLIAVLVIMFVPVVQAQSVDESPDGVVSQPAQRVPLSDSGPQDGKTSDAASSQGPRARATDLMLQKRFDDAYQLLAPFVAAHPDDTQARFLLGMAASESGRRERAIEQFQWILDNDPNLPRVRLELARAYAETGQFDEARSRFKTVLASDPPPYVRQNIELYLAQMAQAPDHKNWQLYLSAGYLYDDNATAGPDAEIAEFFGLPFALSPKAREQSDSAVTATIAFSHYLPIQDNFGLRSKLRFDSVTYFDYGDFNFERFSVSTGPVFYGKRWSLHFPFIASYSRLGSDSYRNAYGVAPEFRYAFSDRWLAIGRGVVTANDYYERDARDGTSWAVSVAARRLIGENGFIELGYRHSRANTDADILSNDRDAVYAALYAELPAQFELYVSPSISWSDYDAREMAFPEVREDERYSVSVNLSHPIVDTGLNATLGYTYTHNDSNITIYEYDRSQIALQISTTF